MSISTYLRDPKRLLAAFARRLFPGTHFGLSWRTRGPFVTFTERGHVAAGSPALLLTRHNYEVQYIRRALAGKNGKRSLEIGCGFGRLTPTFAEFSEDHTAVDVNSEALALARTCYPSSRFLHASATALPFPDAHFDLIETWTVLQHIRPEFIDSALQEIRRVLEGTGMVLMCEETRLPGKESQHAWHRTSAFYAHGLGLGLETTHQFTELDRISDSLNPGEVMILKNF